jgi:hypothetical protein
VNADVQVSVLYRQNAFHAKIDLGSATIRAESEQSEVVAARRCAAEHYQVQPDQVTLRRLTSGNIKLGQPWTFQAGVQS